MRLRVQKTCHSTLHFRALEAPFNIECLHPSNGEDEYPTSLESEPCD